MLLLFSVQQATISHVKSQRIKRSYCFWSNITLKIKGKEKKQLFALKFRAALK
jgi:hypothetical protein